MSDGAFQGAIRVIAEQLRTRAKHVSDEEMAEIICHALHYDGMIVVMRRDWDVAEGLRDAVIRAAHAS